MPPRYAFWTILIDGKPTAFRAREKEELLPTFNQLRRTNTDVVFKWFARGRLWETPEHAQIAARAPKVREKRDRDWRPGGKHADPRARFKKGKRDRPRDARVRAASPGAERERRGRPGEQPWRERKPPKPFRPHHSDRPPHGDRPRRNERPRRDARPASSPVEKPPQRREAEPPPRKEPAPEPPPAPEQIVIKPEPPERG